MIVPDGFFQKAAVKVGINFSCGDVFMSEHLLYRAQIGAALHQVRGECVAEGMRAYRLADAGSCRRLFDNDEDHLAGKPVPSPVQKKEMAAFWFRMQQRTAPLNV